MRGAELEPNGGGSGSAEPGAPADARRRAAGILADSSLELEQQAALARYSLSGQAMLSEEAFDRLVQMAARLYAVPTAMITFYGDGWQWWGASCGLERFGVADAGVAASESLCRRVLQSGRPQFVSDTSLHAEYHDHPMVLSQGVRFHASVPLTSPEGYVIGTFCLMDSRPHAPLTEGEEQTLSDLAQLVMDELELRLLATERQRQASASERLAENLREALAQSETLQAVMALGDLGLSVPETLLRATELCASVCDVDLGSLVAIHEDRAFVFPAWHSARGAALAAQVARGLKRGDCEGLWTGLLTGSQRPVFLNDYGSQPGGHLALAQAGVVAQAHASVGTAGEVRFVMVLSRLHEDRPWRLSQRQLMTALARLTGDLTVQRQRQLALDARTAQLDLVLGSAPLILFSVDRAGVFRLMRGSGEEARLWQPLVGRSVEEAFAQVPQVLGNIQRAMAGESFDDVVQTQGRTYDVRYLPVTDAQGQPAGALGLGYNVTGLVQAEQQATAAKRQAEALLELAQAMTGDVTDPRVADLTLGALTRVLGSGTVALWALRSGRYFPIGRRGAGLDGLTPDLERQATEGVSPGGLPGVLGDVQRRSYLAGRHLPASLGRVGVAGLALLPLLTRDGTCQVVLAAYHHRPWNPAERELLEMASDILGAGLERTLRVSELERAAGTDALTGVGNRRALSLALERSLGEAAGPPPAGLAVVSIDLDGLKAVNDLHGHARGDALLSRFAAELQEALPVGGSLFRLGGDEFVVLAPLAPVAHPDAAHPDATRPDATRPDATRSDERADPLTWLHTAVEATRRAGFERASASAGEARFPRDSAVASELLRLSDERLYAEKERRGRARG